MYSSRNTSQCHQKSDLLELQGMAEDYIKIRKRSMCRYLYRNKSEKYFNNILKGNGVMTTYAKDASGDPKSPINNQINGLFFFASVKLGSTTGEPMEESAFGPRRLVVPVEKLVNYLTDRLYFADFFCMRGKRHYVTLVLTKPDSFADHFCSTRLPELSLTQNNFFFFNTQIGTFRVNTTYNFFVEIFYTENVNVRSLLRSDSWMTDVQIVCNGHSTRGGIKKNPYCSICNLPTTSQAVTNLGHNSYTNLPANSQAATNLGHYSYGNSNSFDSGYSVSPVRSYAPVTNNTGLRVLNESADSRPAGNTYSAAVSPSYGINRNDSWNSAPRVSTTYNTDLWNVDYNEYANRRSSSKKKSWCIII